MIMNSNRIVGFGGADGLGCDPGYIDVGGTCLPQNVGKYVCPSGTSAVNRGTDDDPIWQCEGTGTRSPSDSSGGGSGGGYSSGAPVSQASIAIGAGLVVAGLLGWFAYSLIFPTKD
jgi:hypothetical protein